MRMRIKMKIFIYITLCFLAPISFLQAETKVGDITKIDGLDDNMIRGVGLVAGLNGKGDKGNAIKEAIKNLHKSLGYVKYDLKDIQAGNMAIVHIQAKIPAFSRRGQKIDIEVAAQSAESLEGGKLLDCFLYIVGYDPSDKTQKSIYSKAVAVAQGNVLIGNSGTVGKASFNAGGKKGSQPTSGTVKNGGVVILELPNNYIKTVKDVKNKVVSKSFSLLLSKHSFSNARNIADAINTEFTRDVQKNEKDKNETVSYAVAVTPNEVKVSIPKSYRSEIIKFIARVEDVSLGSIKSEAKVFVNEKTSSITISGEILLNACAIQYQGQNILIAKDENLQAVLQKLSDYFETKDQISILHQLHTAGHLRAKFEAQ